MRAIPVPRSVIRLALSALVAAALPGASAHACTAFCVYRAGRALFANNEDHWRTDTRLCFDGFATEALPSATNGASSATAAISPTT